MSDDKEKIIPFDLNELIGIKPGWIIRFGSLFIFILVISAVISSWFIRYPETVKQRIEIRKVDESKETAIMYLSGADLIKVKSGQSVLAKLDKRTEQSGIEINGMVDSIVNHPGGLSGTVYITFDVKSIGEGAITKDDRFGYAEITTSESRLINRLIKKF